MESFWKDRIGCLVAGPHLPSSCGCRGDRNRDPSGGGFKVGLRAEVLASDLGLNPGSAVVQSGCRDGVRLEGAEPDAAPAAQSRAWALPDEGQGQPAHHDLSYRLVMRV